METITRPNANETLNHLFTKIEENFTVGRLIEMSSLIAEALSAQSINAHKEPDTNRITYAVEVSGKSALAANTKNQQEHPDIDGDKTYLLKIDYPSDMKLINKACDQVVKIGLQKLIEFILLDKKLIYAHNLVLYGPVINSMVEEIFVEHKDPFPQHMSDYINLNFEDFFNAHASMRMKNLKARLFNALKDDGLNPEKNRDSIKVTTTDNRLEAKILRIELCVKDEPNRLNIDLKFLHNTNVIDFKNADRCLEVLNLDQTERIEYLAEALRAYRYAFSSQKAQPDIAKQDACTISHDEAIELSQRILSKFASSNNKKHTNRRISVIIDKAIVHKN